MHLSASAEGSLPEHQHIADTCLELLIKQDNEGDMIECLYNPPHNEPFTSLQDDSPTIFINLGVRDMDGNTH
jgi:hypothetical protein